MASALLPVFSDSFFSYQITLAGNLWLFEYEWKDRLGAVYLSIYSALGTPIVQGKRLSPNAGFSVETQGGPPGLFIYLIEENEQGDYTRREAREQNAGLAYINNLAEI